ncbi:hypothetical protein PsorP6_006701 [Peronosclerospora sorghi]|uniref:Uncharacterized protein n=1 Tax=Peronosclerospora sorghi TaxID=230839 RepID=A0ACC0W313_9STRA|nr:hypothetical protein PsorP6_006701 [Peronosclerospora sorghi]
MGVRAHEQHHQVHSLQLTATILTHLGTHLPAIPGRQTLPPKRLPGIRSLFAFNARQPVASVLPPLQCAVGLINLRTPSTGHDSFVNSPLKPAVGSPTSPGMIVSTTGSKRSTTTTITSKTRRPLSLDDLLSTDTSSTLSAQRSKNVHHRRQCGIADCHKYALTGGFCIRHGGGKRCNFDGCQTVAQSGGRCKAHVSVKSVDAAVSRGGKDSVCSMVADSNAKSTIAPSARMVAAFASPMEAGNAVRPRPATKVHRPVASAIATGAGNDVPHPNVSKPRGKVAFAFDTASLRHFSSVEDTHARPSLTNRYHEPVFLSLDKSIHCFQTVTFEN